MIYLDYASNTPADSEVLKAFLETEQQFIGNPNSRHQAGRMALEKMNMLTENIAELLSVKPTEIIYTSGASEANNLALKGLARAYRHSGKHILTTCLEHSSVSGTLTALQEQGYEIELINIGHDGCVDIEQLQELLRKDTVIVSICYVDSELGSIQPIPEIIKILEAFPNCHLHVDATQAIGKIPIITKGIDCLTFAPHKFYGLNGCGLLVKQEGVILEPLIHGGISTSIYRSGTPTVALAAAIEKALTLVLKQLPERTTYVQSLKKQLEDTLLKYPLVRINSPKMASPYILNLSIKGIKSQTVQECLDAYGVCISTKSACSVPGTPSRPVVAVTGDKKNGISSFRISLSHLTTIEEIIEFLKIFDGCYKELTN